MSPVWRPVEDPPCLDKFCHLSLDAQRVMGAIFEDFKSRKRELLQSTTSREYSVTNASDYYRSKYEARFEPMYRPQNQEPSPYEQSWDSPVTGDPIQNTSVDYLYQTRNQDLSRVEHGKSFLTSGPVHYPYNSKTDRILENSWAEDTSTYSDSPPIETQGYRFLSQLTRNEANLDQQDGSFSTDNSKQTDNTTFSNFGSRSHLNPVYDKRHTSIGYEHDEGLKQNKNNRLQMSKRSLETGSEISIDSFKDTADESTGFSTPTFVLNTDIADPIRGNEPFMYTAEKIVSEKGISEVTVTETSSFSQSLFSQDSLSGHTVTPNKKRAPKTKACVTKRKRFEKSELKTNTFHIEKSNGQSTSLSLSDMHIENNEDAILDITKPQALNRQHNCVYATDRAKRTGAAGKDRDTHLVDNYSSHGGNRDSFKLSAEIDPKLEKKIHVPSFHAIGLVQSIDNIHLDEESPFLTNNLKLKECGTHTPVRKQPDIESPFRQCGAGKDVYDIFKISSKKDSASLIKRPTQPVTECLPSSSKKRPGACKGFAVPIKKVKTNIPDNKDTRKAACQVMDASASSQDRQEQIINKLLESPEVIISLVYESGATQLRESVFSQEPKKRGMTRKSLDKLRGVVCTSRSIPNDVYLFPFVQTEDTFFKTSRSFLLKLLRGETRKVGVHVQKTFLEILRYVSWDTSKVETSWTILDPVIAVWLLDPDNPVNNLEQILTKVGMPPMAPSNCCLDMIYEDMMLLGVAMERLYKQLQAKELWDLFICVEMKLTPLLAVLEMTPLTVATHTLMQFSEILKKKCIKLEKEAHEAAGHAFLLTSPSQLRQVLFEELQLDTKLPSKSRLARTSVGRETSTSESVLTQLSPFHPLPGIILEYRQVQKLKSTYIDGILSCVEDDHLRTNWDQTAAATGRLTAYQPNVQAIPKIPVTITRYKENYIAGRESGESIDIYARDAFVSQQGWTLLAADFQQIELRLLAHLADDLVLLKLFNDKEIPDIFNALTAQWLGKSVEAISTLEREQTKRVVYSIMYGVGKEKLAEHLKMSVDQAKAIMASFLVKFPAVKQFTQTCVEFCKKNGYCCSIFKRRRLIPNIRHPSPVFRAQAERQAVNFCIQGSAADICKAAMIQIVHALSEREEVTARLLMQIHDELLLEVLDSDLDLVTGLVKEVMESSDKLCGSVIKLKVPLPVSLSTGKTWGHMTPVESGQKT